MRISDWSSDVCSSDLHQRDYLARLYSVLSGSDGATAAAAGARSEERRVGKECAVRVDLGGRRIIKQNKTDAPIANKGTHRPSKSTRHHHDNKQHVQSTN